MYPSYSPFSSPGGSGSSPFSQGLSPSSSQPYPLSPPGAAQMSALPPFQPTPFFNNNQPGFVHSVEPGMLKGYIQLHNCGELLYFHFSQVMGNPTHLCAGQYVDVEVLRDMQSGLLRTHKVYMHMHSGYGAGQPFHQNHPYQRQSSQQQQQLPPLMQQPPGQVPPQSPSPSSSSRLRKGALYSIGMERQRGKVDSEPAARRSQSPTAVSVRAEKLAEVQCGKLDGGGWQAVAVVGHRSAL